MFCYKVLDIRTFGIADIDANGKVVSWRRSPAI